MFDALNWQPSRSLSDSGHAIENEVVERRRCTLQFASGFLYLDAIATPETAIFGHDPIANDGTDCAGENALAERLSKLDPDYRCIQLANSFGNALQWAMSAAKNAASPSRIAVIDADFGSSQGSSTFLIADENRSFARHGRWLASSRWSQKPDLAVFGDSLAGGDFGAVLVRRNAALDASGLAGPFAPSPTAMAAALTAIQTIEQDRLIQQGSDLGVYLAARLNSVKASCTEIKAVLANGLTATVEFIDSGLPRQMKRALCERGVLVGVDRFNRLCISLSLVIRPAEIDVVAGALRAALLKQPTWRQSPCCSACEIDDVQTGM